VLTARIRVFLGLLTALGDALFYGAFLNGIGLLIRGFVQG